MCRCCLFGWQFESSRDAEDAIRGRDGYNFDGCRLRVQGFSLFIIIYYAHLVVDLKLGFNFH